MSTLLTTTYSNLATLASTANTGDSYFETDNKRIVTWNGTDWTYYNNDGSVFPVVGINNTLSAYFDGSNDAIDCGSSTGLDFGSGPFSINMWAKQLDTSVNVLIERTSGSGGFQLSFNSGVFKWYGYNADGFLDFGSGLGTTAWYMLTITHTGGSGSSATVKGYINGVLDTTYTGKNYTPATSGSWIMGRSASGYGTNGFMDEVGVWTKVLTASEISTIYNSGVPTDISSSGNLLAWWRMGDGSGDTNSSSGTPASGDIIGTVKNLANPGTHDGTGSGGALYSSTTP